MTRALSTATLALGLLTVTCGAAVARHRAGGETPKSTLQQALEGLRQEAESLKGDLDSAREEQADLAEEEQRLTATADLLKGAIQHFQADVQKYKEDFRAQEAAVAGHNAQRCTYPEGHPEACDQYEAKARQLNATSAQIEERGANLDQYRQGLEERRADLNNAVLDWAQRKKSNNALLEELEAKERRAVEQVKRLTLDDQFLRDLRLRKIVSEQCSEMGNLEAASQCLQAVYDGAARIRR